MSFKYAGGPTTGRWLLIKQDATVEANEALMVNTAPYCSRVTSGKLPLGVTDRDVESPASDGATKVWVYDNPNTEFWVNAFNGTLLAAMATKCCDMHDHNTIDLTAATDKVVEIIEVDTVNSRARVRLRFDKARQETGVV